MVILATLFDGRTVASGSSTFVLPTAGNYAVTVTISEHRNTERMLQYRPRTDPDTDPGVPTDDVIVRNVVGFTLMGVGAGTTLTVEVIATGF
jgi:hypothetical protein